jgi:hypothetical protein
VQYSPEPLLQRTKWAHDLGLLVLLALFLIPLYLLLNQYWKSIIVLLVVYGMLGLGFFRLARYVRRVMRRNPAEIPPWQGGLARPESMPQAEAQFAAAEAIQSVHNDPYYLQDVMQPRLRQLLAYRLSGTPEAVLESLTPTHSLRIDPALLACLHRRHATGLLAKYCYRWQRLQDVLLALRRLEAL